MGAGGVIEVTGSVQLAAWQSGIMPPVEQIRPTVWSVPVDCAEFPIRYTFAYLVVADGGKFVLIDPGHNTATASRQVLEGIAAAGLRKQDLVGTIVTHFHVDHIGGAPALVHGTDAWFGMHANELFIGLAERAAELRRHHAERADEVRSVLDEGSASVWEVAQRLSWRRGWDALDGTNLRAALGETRAHMNHLAVLASA